MPNAAIKLDEITRGYKTSGRPSGRETLEDFPEPESRRQLHIFQDSTPGVRTAVHPEIARRSAAPDLASDDTVRLFDGSDPRFETARTESTTKR